MCKNRSMRSSSVKTVETDRQREGWELLNISAEFSKGYSTISAQFSLPVAITYVTSMFSSHFVCEFDVICYECAGLRAESAFVCKTSVFPKYLAGSNHTVRSIPEHAGVNLNYT